MAIKIESVGIPVIFTNNAGGGVDEIQAPPGGHTTKDLPAGGKVQEAWYTAVDNIGDLPGIHHIDCRPHGNNVSLEVGGTPGQRDARVRIRVYAAIEV